MKEKANNMNAADKKAANEKRLATMRANLDTLESKAEKILDKGAENLTTEERYMLLSLLNIAYHTSGKIEDAASIDSTAACAFCEKMRGAAKGNPLTICSFCYAAADSWKEAAWRRHKLNARILSSVLFTETELSSLVIPSKVCRINEDGDTINETHARNILRIIKTHAGVLFGYWYKNTAAVAAGIYAEGYTAKEQLPKNARFVQSSILIGFPARPVWFSDVVFTVYPDKWETLDAIDAGAWECNGRKCNECGWNCYKARQENEQVQHVAELLRTNAARRAEVMTAYNEKKGK